MAMSTINIRKLGHVLVCVGIVFVVQLNGQVVHTNASENHLRVTDHIFGIGVMRHLKFETANIRVAA